MKEGQVIYFDGHMGVFVKSKDIWRCGEFRILNIHRWLPYGFRITKIKNVEDKL